LALGHDEPASESSRTTNQVLFSIVREPIEATLIPDEALFILIPVVIDSGFLWQTVDREMCHPILS
jgi:hypothetical protein